MFKQIWEEVEKAVESETEGKKVDLDNDTKEEVVLKENEEELIVEDEENVEF